jgi:hypothetical protein
MAILPAPRFRQVPDARSASGQQAAGDPSALRNRRPAQSAAAAQPASVGRTPSDTVRTYATNLTLENEEALLTCLTRLGVTPEQLDDLVRESYRRDTGRSIAFGAANSLSRLLDLALGEAIKSLHPHSRANKVPIGSFVNGVVSTAVQTGGKSLGPTYHPEPRIHERGYDLFGAQGDTIRYDDPYFPVGIAHFVASALSQVMNASEGRAYAISSSLIVLGYMARGYKTFKNEEAIRTAGETNMRQPWLDAADLDKTEAAIVALKKPRLQALAGYATEVGNVLIKNPVAAAKVAMTSPRTIAHTLSVLPGGIVDAFGRAQTERRTSDGLSLMATAVNLFGLQHRLHIEYALTSALNKVFGKNWNHAGQVDKTSLGSGGRNVPGDVEAGVTEAGVTPVNRT